MKSKVCVLTIRALCGAAAGFIAAIAIMATAAPRLSESGLRLAEAAELDRLSAALARLPDPSNPVLPFALLAAAAAFWLSLVRALNPALAKFPFSSARPGRAWAVVAAATAVMIATAAFGLQVPTLDAAGPAAMLGGALVWLLLAPSGVAADLSGGWKERLAAARENGLRVALLGAAFGGCVVAGLGGAQRLFDFITELVYFVWYASPVAKVGGFTAILEAAIGISALAAVGIGSLADALADSGDEPGARILRAAPALAIALVCGGGGLALRSSARANYDWGAGGVEQAARVPDAKAPALIAVSFSFNKLPRYSALPWKVKSGWDGRGTAATAANAAALAEYGAARALTSRYGVSALIRAFEIRALLWDSEAAFLPLRSDPRTDQYFMARFMERAWLSRAAPVTAANRARLAAISDEKAYQLRGRSALALAHAWTRFGDLKRAAALRDLAVATGVSAKPAELALPAKAPLANGRVSGRLVLKGRPAKGARVGLFAARNREGLSLTEGSGLLVSLAAAATLGADGAFSFGDLGAGDYTIAFLVPESELHPQIPSTGSPHPGLITLDAAHPRRDLGTISIAQR
jgi:hypothetical protein